jgi:drug/metabolite transporter (DMT)-like permease
MADTAQPPARSQHARGVGLMVLSALAFTINVLLIRGIAQFESVDIWLVSCARFVVGLILVATLYPREWQPSHLLRSAKLAERGLIGGLGVVAYYATVVHLGAGRATFINNTYVIWGALLAVFILHEPLRRAVVVGSVAALAGLGLLTGAFAHVATVDGYDVLAVACAVASGYIVVTIRQLHATEHSATIFSAQCVYGLVVCGGPLLFHLQPVSLAAAAMLVAASVCAGLGQLTMTRAFRDLSVAEGSLLQMIVPLGIALGEAVLFGARFSTAELAGATLVLLGSCLPALSR